MRWRRVRSCAVSTTCSPPRGSPARTTRAVGSASEGQPNRFTRSPGRVMKRPTIGDIAVRAGVSKGAVSYALNNQPGVSEATRARVLKVAEELEWVPNRAARQLSAARSETLGLVLARSAKTLSEEPFYMGFVGGVESVLSEKGYALALQVVPDLESEMATYRKWAAEQRVDGVIIV